MGLVVPASIRRVPVERELSLTVGNLRSDRGVVNEEALTYTTQLLATEQLQAQSEVPAVYLLEPCDGAHGTRELIVRPTPSHE